MPSQYINIDQAAEYLAVNRRSIWKYMTRGIAGVKLKYVIVGGRKRTTEAFCDEFVQARSNQPEAG